MRASPSPSRARRRSHGAAIANYAPVRELVKEHDRVVGALVEADGREIVVRTRSVVNAAGVWADDVRALDEGRHPASIRPAKGIHITVPWSKVRNDIAAIVPVSGDRRSVFVVPWGDTTYVGTTDTDYDGPLDNPSCNPADVDYLLGAINGVSDEKLTESDVVGSWAGLRPLLRSGRNSRTADLSRRHSVRVAASGVVTVTGGKLTTYRRMAADAVDTTLGVLGERGRPSRTKHLRLFGGEGIAPPIAALETSTHEHLTGRFGTDAGTVLALVADDPDLGAPLVPGLPYLRAEARYAVRHEMAQTLDDVLSRRTRARSARARRLGERRRRRRRTAGAPISGGRPLNATRRSPRTARRSPPSAATSSEPAARARSPRSPKRSWIASPRCARSSAPRARSRPRAATGGHSP